MSLVALAAAAAMVALPIGEAPPREEAITAPGPLGALAGTWARTKPGAPIVLIIPGSGPTDRDGDSPLGITAQSYRLLADALAERGIASVRIDKRGMFGSKAAVADPNAVTLDDYAADVHAWIAAIRAQTGARCVWVAGHSEGGLVALAAARQPAAICGLVLISAPGRRLDVVMRAQFHANPANAPILADADAALDALAAGHDADVSRMHPVVQRIFAPRVQGFLKSLFALDPARLIAGYAGPVLIVQGDRDLQVSVADAEALHEAQPHARLAIIPGMNHVLKAVAGDDRAANLATYGDESLPLAPGVAEAIAGFIAAPR
ncbi:alpha/beta fold hydrolase [uncultured Sphingomonas sp.]|uniref:alpha/beta hydrolase n=1 Tax=uncultured Sphingomonas sp. TaxID=158754 RepID=UPI0026034A16|nr:alpha/beta fold hydrolase [uncultured Sphingomonas sp.]